MMGIRQPGPKIFVIADDLTGANDAGVQIAKRGLETITLLDPTLLAEVRVPALVFDTESRGLSADEAREAVGNAVRRLDLSTAPLVYKKIDSTLRGNIGIELGALIEELSPDKVVCAPAYPKNGRTTRGGIHRVGGVPIAETEIAADPVSPVRTSLLPSLLSRGGHEFGHVTIEVLRSPRAGEAVLSRSFLSFDCEEQEDLERIVTLAEGTGRRVLWCGSAGLAEVLFERYALPGPRGRLSPDSDRSLRRAVEAARRNRTGRRALLAVVGSTSEVTRRQVGAAIASGAALLLLEPAAAAASFDTERSRLAGELARLAASAKPSSGKPLRLILSIRPESPSATARKELSSIAARCLGAAAADFLRANPIDGLFLTGGQTAYEVARAAAVRGMVVEKELSPGIPQVRFIGGILDGLLGVTKAGGFGDEETLLRSFDTFAHL